jgi:hypothetical protein
LGGRAAGGWAHWTSLVVVRSTGRLFSARCAVVAAVEAPRLVQRMLVAGTRTEVSSRAFTGHRGRSAGCISDPKGLGKPLGSCPGCAPVIVFPLVSFFYSRPGVWRRGICNKRAWYKCPWRIDLARNGGRTAAGWRPLMWSGFVCMSGMQPAAGRDCSTNVLTCQVVGLAGSPAFCILSEGYFEVHLSEGEMVDHARPST